MIIVVSLCHHTWLCRNGIDGKALSILSRHSREGGNLVERHLFNWIPAFAGMK